ncbi:alpha/beta fold hydrolase [Dyadobacter sp. CY261]|uniref:alpha/beta hydrolase family protein n=1 Tax=Dyadobacter sp. CY261 TaxID=2907203 RepID=UPI001F1937B5|nr:alpha/beta fold hydrolase [Dyadobacter sp. CY261]MCF0070990.1 alpha/beta fold hydrolase [Dyadobacter sp. CY261]
MKKIIAILLLLAPAAHAQYSQPWLIDTKDLCADSLLWDLKDLSNAPQFRWLDNAGPVRSLLYQSVDYEGKPTEVFAYYSNPDIIAGKPASKQKFPGLVLIHGGGGKAFREWVEKWAKEGYAAIAMDLSGNGPDGQKVAHPGPEQSNDNKFKKIEKSNLRDVWTYHAVASSILAHSLLLSFPEIDPIKTGVTGISWGGYLTCMVASLDNRFIAAAPVYGCGYYIESDVFKEPLNALSASNRKLWITYFDPSSYLWYAKPFMFFINGNKDKHYNVAPYIKTYGMSRNKQVCIIPDMPHSHQDGWAPAEIKTFFDGALNGNPWPFVGLKYITLEDNQLTAHLKSVTGKNIASAEFYYTNDVTSDNEHRVWQHSPVTINKDTQTIIQPVPAGGYKYAFFYLKDSDGVSGTTEFLKDGK